MLVTIKTGMFHAVADLGDSLLLCTVPVNGYRRSPLRFQYTMLMNHVRH